MRKMNKRQRKKEKYGCIMSKSKIRKRVKNVKLLERPKTIYDGFGISDVFCPFCGCDLIEWSGNRVEYPEIWETGYCERCGEKIAGADNSPCHHILRDMLEYPDISIEELQAEY